MNEFCLKYLELLIKLHILIFKGKDDSDESENIRDLMSNVSKSLSKEQIDIFRQISENLFKLSL